MNTLSKKFLEAGKTLGVAILFAIPPVTLIFATIVKIFPRNGVFTFLFSLISSIFIGLLIEEMQEAVMIVVLCCSFFVVEMLIILNLPILVGVITRDVNLWIMGSLSLTIRLSFYTIPSIILGSFLGMIAREFIEK